ncbi:hypothetical protein OUZ56_014501 [Daphnia magna]|uniref:Uncharacterized protein n=1 Tax=Daphnia magna TaxID=35525 RepID=A0ABR0AJY4_9CRUS|nr:hypothetical protein OUZ56_014501 [Daphnia magna]
MWIASVYRLRKQKDVNKYQPNEEMAESAAHLVRVRCNIKRPSRCSFHFLLAEFDIKKGRADRDVNRPLIAAVSC